MEKVLYKRDNFKGKNKKRYLLVDGFRGVSIISMVIFHFLYDVNEIFGMNTAWYENVNVYIWQQSICWTFIIISGFVWQLGIKSNLKRGIFLNVCGIGISVVTAIIIPSEAVWFGILNFMGCAVLIMMLLHKLAEKIPPLPGMVLGMAIFVICRNITEGTIGIKGIVVIELPNWLYESRILTPLGFPYQGFASSDYFPVLPWIGLFLFGYYLFSCLKETGKLEAYAYQNIPVLSKIGQMSIGIYILHQPICMVVCAIIMQCREFFSLTL